MPSNVTNKQTEDVKTFARRNRSKFDSYLDKTDMELGRRVLERYFSLSLENNALKIIRDTLPKIQTI